MRSVWARLRPALPAVAECFAAVALANRAVALLEQAAPATGLSVLYLLAVMAIAVRRGEAAAGATAVLSVLSFTWFFIEPRHRLSIAAGRDAAVLTVFLVVAL